jgi:hypothetical protein
MTVQGVQLPPESVATVEALAERYGVPIEDLRNLVVDFAKHPTMTDDEREFSLRCLIEAHPPN